MEETHITITLGNQVFRIRSDSQGEECLRALESKVNQRLDDVSSRNPRFSSNECALFAMYKLMAEFQEQGDAMSRLDGIIRQRQDDRFRDSEIRSQTQRETVTTPAKRPFVSKKDEN